MFASFHSNKCAHKIYAALRSPSWSCAITITITIITVRAREVRVWGGERGGERLLANVVVLRQRTLRLETRVAEHIRGRVHVIWLRPTH